MGGFASIERASVKMFNHILPQQFLTEFLNVARGLEDMGKRVRNPPAIMDLEARFRMMDDFGEHGQVILLAAPTAGLPATPVV